MTIWAILTFLCDFFKVAHFADIFWAKHEQHEAIQVQNGINSMDDGYVLARLRSKYSRD